MGRRAKESSFANSRMTSRTIADTLPTPLVSSHAKVAYL
jgi:hypothetical protein